MDDSVALLILRENQRLARRIEVIEETISNELPSNRKTNQRASAIFDFVRSQDELTRLRVEEFLRQRWKYVVDPVPDDIVNLKLGELLERVPGGGFTDPAPDDIVNLKLGELLERIPGGGFTDPAPDDIVNLKLGELLERVPGGGFTDPAPDDIVNLKLGELFKGIPGGGFTDPAPDDLRHFSKIELEAQLHRVNTEQIKLDSLKNMISARLEELAD